MGNNKNVLVTGASSGIGYHLAKCFAKNGYNLVVISRDQDEINQVAKDLSSEFSITATPIAADLFNKDAAKDIYKQIKDKNIQIDILVNDAGQGQWGKFWETDLDRQLEIVQLNICSLISLNHLFLKDMVQRNEGKILNVGSIAGTSPAPLLGVYGATKAFVNYFSEALHNELKDTNITLTVLMPGATESNFWEKADSRDTTIGMSDKATPESVAQAGYDALMQGKDKVIPGFMNNVQAMANNVTPDQNSAEIFRATMVKTGK